MGDGCSVFLLRGFGGFRRILVFILSSVEGGGLETLCFLGSFGTSGLLLDLVVSVGFIIE